MADKILIVDDNPDFLNIVVKILKTEFEVDTASTAIDALALVTSQPDYKALILDVSLPDYTGYYLGKLIRKDHAKIPIAFLTNYDGEVSRENAEDIGAEFWKKSDIVSSLKVLPAKIRQLYQHE